MPSSGPAGGHKLRGSCHACAVSKVRCSKEKPICSRCRRRATACEYLVTKRPGRKQHGSRLSERPAPTSIPQGLPEPGLPTTTFALPETPSLPVEDVSPGCSDVFSSLFDPVESSLSSSLTSLSTDFEDYLAAFPLPETGSVDAAGSMQALPSEDQSEFSPGLHSGSAATQVAPGDTISLFGLPASASRSPANLGTLFAGTGETPHRGPMASQCHCFSRALDLLKHLTAADLIPGATPGRPTAECFGFLAPSAESMILTNQEAMKAINSILDCGCLQDSYLLAILSLVIFKILDRYAMAAEIGAARVDNDESLSSLPYPSPESIRLPASTGRADAGRESECRVKTAQCVLRELHRVQRAVNQLSPKLNGHKTQHRPSATPISLFSTNTSSAVSNPVMDQLEPELRKRLGALSLEIINILGSGDS
ncbi:C6 transcription factor [Aspergillus terreus]|uniref:C6 transcription factor n=1 Tax=Aspergillus terreus TaxID=33178 RepID=A0A5M3Z1X3_ASPTE|nr:hypothetical protein ATETN484_0007059700 [Aspergillus terreus]GFF16564.1 C6 transcription factor [Aspergillus terreus]